MRAIFKLISLSLFSLFFCGAVCFAQQPSTGAPKPAAKQSDDYRLGAGDLIGVVVLNHPEYSADFLVPRGGNVIFPDAGTIDVTGRTIAEVTKLLAVRYKDVLLEPRVTVILKTARIQQVSIVGDVQKPTSFPLLPGTRVADAIGTGGGVPPEIKASDCQVTILHRNGDKVVVSMVDVLAGVPTANLPLTDGDSVSVDSGLFTVYVEGEVKTPGLTRVKRGGSVLEAIASAGGALDTGAIDRVRVSSVASGKEFTFDLVPALVKGESAKFPTLSAGDYVEVPKIDKQFAVLGYVQAPGIFPLPPGQHITLANALTLAKGETQTGRFSRITITHIENGKPSVLKYYDFGKFLTKGDRSQNPEIFAGDLVYVPQSNKIPSNTVLSSAVSLALIWNVFKK